MSEKTKQENAEQRRALRIKVEIIDADTGDVLETNSQVFASAVVSGYIPSKDGQSLDIMVNRVGPMQDNELLWLSELMRSEATKGITFSQFERHLQKKLGGPNARGPATEGKPPIEIVRGASKELDALTKKTQ